MAPPSRTPPAHAYDVEDGEQSYLPSREVSLTWRAPSLSRQDVNTFCWSSRVQKEIEGE